MGIQKGVAAGERDLPPHVSVFAEIAKVIEDSKALIQLERGTIASIVQ
jgi:hypothetical protein